MPRNAATKQPTKPPGGVRVNAAEVERRLQATEEMLARGDDRARVVMALHTRFKVSPRTADDYMARVRERWRAASAETLPERQQAARVRLRKLRETLAAEKSWGALIAVERLAADVDGLRSHTATTLIPAAHPTVEEFSVAEANEIVRRSFCAMARATTRRPASPENDALRRELIEDCERVLQSLREGSMQAQLEPREH